MNQYDLLIVSVFAYACIRPTYPSLSQKASVLIVFKADTSSETVITMYRITHWTARLRFTKSVPEPLAQSISIKSLVFLILYSAYCDV